MHLSHISLLNFKNYHELSLDLSPEINCFTGNNGAGKTNLLDAVHYLSFCKSYFNPFDNQNILHGEDMFVIQGIFNKDEQEEEVYCAQKKNERKQFKRNKKEYNRLSEHIGLLPVVMISPEDIELVQAGGETRRKFVDSIISQADKDYLNDLIEYNRTLLQRNATLKSSYGNADQTLMSVWNGQMTASGTRIFEKRKAFTDKFSEIFGGIYTEISGSGESVSLQYASQLLEGGFEELLARALPKDTLVQYSTAGIHKDDWLFFKDGHPVKRFASQGQQKSFIIALKLAQFYFLKNNAGTAPILLLDDMFDKLDDERISRLAEKITGKDFGQIFITDTNPGRLQKLFGGKAKECIIVPIKEGGLLKAPSAQIHYT
jgi:DNA replication and repair protein RecF